MFDKLDDLLIRFEELMSELSEPDVANNPERFRKLMKEQSDLAPIVAAYKEYKQCKQNIADSLAMLDEESDEEMRELAKEELNDAKARVEELEHELKILLLPKDPNDDKNVIVEIRAGAGGDEAALFAAEIYRMYQHYAESKNWKTEIVEADETGIGGMKSVTFMINGQGAYSLMKYESGVHRVQRVPETESGGRIHTSTISVAVMPEVDDDIAIEWMRIPHFYYNYYVFLYATGYAAAIALSRRILREGAPAVKDYIGFLSGGCSKSPIDLLKGAGVDMSTTKPVEEALSLFGELIGEMEELMKD